MSNYPYQSYRNTKLVIEKIRSEGYWVTVSYIPRTITSFISPDGNCPTEVIFSEKYNTLDYSTADEAIAEAKGRVDCMEHYYSCNQTDPNGNEDSYKNAYEKDSLRHQSSPEYKDALSTSAAEALDLAYKTGWASKLSELKNIDGDVGS